MRNVMERYNAECGPPVVIVTTALQVLAVIQEKLVAYMGIVLVAPIAIQVFILH